MVGAEFLVFLSCALAISLAAATIPELIRLSVFYVLLGMRSKLYRIADENGSYREQLPYRDMEWCICRAIHDVREGNVDTLASQFLAIDEDREVESWRDAQYLRVAQEFAEEFDETLTLVMPMLALVHLYVVTKRNAGVFLLGAMVLPLYYGFKWAVSWLGTGGVHGARWMLGAITQTPRGRVMAR